jgi:hypothetical protein
MTSVNACPYVRRSPARPNQGCARRPECPAHHGRQALSYSRGITASTDDSVHGGDRRGGGQHQLSTRSETTGNDKDQPKAAEASAITYCTHTTSAWPR